MPTLADMIIHRAYHEGFPISFIEQCVAEGIVDRVVAEADQDNPYWLLRTPCTSQNLSRFTTFFQNFPPTDLDLGFCNEAGTQTSFLVPAGSGQDDAAALDWVEAAQPPLVFPGDIEAHLEAAAAAAAAAAQQAPPQPVHYHRHHHHHRTVSAGAGRHGHRGPSQPAQPDAHATGNQGGAELFDPATDPRVAAQEAKVAEILASGPYAAMTVGGTSPSDPPVTYIYPTYHLGHRLIIPRYQRGQDRPSPWDELVFGRTEAAMERWYRELRDRAIQEEARLRRERSRSRSLSGAALAKKAKQCADKLAACLKQAFPGLTAAAAAAAAAASPKKKDKQQPQPQLGRAGSTHYFTYAPGVGNILVINLPTPAPTTAPAAGAAPGPGQGLQRECAAQRPRVTAASLRKLPHASSSLPEGAVFAQQPPCVMGRA